MRRSRPAFGPEGIGFTDDTVWIANVRDNSVSRIDPETNTLVDTRETGALTEGILVDPDGLVYAAVTGALGIAGLDPDTGEQVTSYSTGNEPRRMVIVDGELWVTNTGDGTVQVIELELTLSDREFARIADGRAAVARSWPLP